MTTNTNVAVIDTEQKALLDQLTGQQGTVGTTSIVALPRIKVSTSHDFDGEYTFRYEEEDVYASSLKVRLLNRYFQYQRYIEGDDGGYICTTMELSPGAEFPDELGTYKLGKVTGAAAQDLSPEQKEINRDKGKFMLRVFCLVSGVVKKVVGYEEEEVGKSKKLVRVPITEDIEVSNYPTQLIFTGGSAVDILREFFQNKAYFGRGKPSSYEYEVILPTGLKKMTSSSGTVSWYPLRLELGNRLPVTQDIVDSITHVANEVKKFNENIMAKHKEAVNKDKKEEAVYNIEGIDTKLDDEIPF